MHDLYNRVIVTWIVQTSSSVQRAAAIDREVFGVGNLSLIALALELDDDGNIRRQRMVVVFVFGRAVCSSRLSRGFPKS